MTSWGLEATRTRSGSLESRREVFGFQPDSRALVRMVTDSGVGLLFELSEMAWRILLMRSSIVVVKLWIVERVAESQKVKALSLCGDFAKISSKVNRLQVL